MKKFLLILVISVGFTACKGSASPGEKTYTITLSTVSDNDSVVSLVQAPSSITNASQLTYSDIKTLVTEAVALAGGLDGIVKYGDTVVLKPNIIVTNYSWGYGPTIP
ncbi:MAG: hypothetical protein LBH20_03960, partial [Treponema sp.]|nr:hypothetical protein [Treponema sp.]